MKILDCLEKLTEVFACFVDGESGLFYDAVVKLFALGQFGDDEDEFLGLLDLQQFENVWVVDTFEDFKLILDSLNIF